ncbi:large subunit ribosomal protein L25 [Antricoccus suffuscus]|uniref:Large ribosomal subunit protein bL25 n=1 Tax=Antricoccus suffuscus TaxID=1629062 RepID=A0A2T1A020_9ACTN|nr:50S ribosomal protein L25/general stress protein Ctc [Antricoccus suffuscus]PRZ41942.1 large subunit ribosomal protein L25 [Antricoccus suffuscus]
MSDEVRIPATKRSEFGKGSARRTRREGNIPAVLYGHGTDPVHLALAGHTLTMALRHGGTNTLLTIEVDGDDVLALPKDLQIHPIKRIISHLDLLIVRKGQKVHVDVPIVLVGEAAPGTQINTDMQEVSIEAEATNIPETIEVNIDGFEIGTQVLASDLQLPSGSVLVSDPETLVLNIVEPQEADTDSDAEAEETATEASSEASDAEPAGEADKSDEE